MEVWLWAVVGILACVVVILSVKIYLLRKSMKEIQEGFADRLVTETNTLLTTFSHDKYVRQLAESLNIQLRGLRSARLRYQQGDLELKEAVSNISHDIRTPLTAVCGYLELLKELPVQPLTPEDKAKAERYLEMMDNRLEALNKLTEELFRYSVAVSTIQDTPYEKVVLNNVLEESVSANYAALKERKITPDIFMPEKDITCMLNKNALSRIFGNIIGNAIKYSDGDLCIRLLESGEIIFSNHAAQLDEVQVGKLFDRFYTVETARKSTGLGLSIAKALTERMNGMITARYQSGVLSIHIVFDTEKK